MANDNITKLELGTIEKNKSNLANSALFFVLLALILSIADFDVFLLRIPELNQLETNEGTIDFSLTPLSRGSSLILNNHGNSIELNCWITSSGMKDCITSEDKNIFRGKEAKAWWYKARINGFSTESRLLQLEVEGKTVISYFEQKDKYLKSKRDYVYVWPMFLFIAVFLYIAALLSNNHRNLHK